MDRYGGCFAPTSPIKLFDGTSCQIQFIRPGARVWGGADVQIVLQMNWDAIVPMVFLEGLFGEDFCIQALHLRTIYNLQVLSRLL